MKRYECSDKFISRLIWKRRMFGLLVLLAVCIIVVDLGMIFFADESFNELKKAIWRKRLFDTDEPLIRELWILLITFVVLMIIDVIFVIRTNIFISNIEHQYLEISRSKICGIACYTPNKKDTYKFFDIPFEKISKIEVETASISRKIYWNLVVYTPEQTCRLCIEDPQKAATEINNLINIHNGCHFS